MLALVDVDTVEPGEGQVRVSVRAAGVNPRDAKLRSGLFAQRRPLESGHRTGKIVISTS